MELIPVPGEISETAVRALAACAEHGRGRTARGVVIATALGTGYLRAHELGEIRRWHARHPEQVRDGLCTLTAGLYGGASARAFLAAARNPEQTGAMIALGVPEKIAAQLARPDGEPADAYHVTLFHLAHDARELSAERRALIAAALADAVPHATPPSLDFSHVERFSPTDEGLEPVVLVADEPSVYELRAQIKDALDMAGQNFYSDDHAFRAHLTIGYYPPGLGPAAGPIEDSLGTELPILEPETVDLHWGPDVESFPLPARVQTAAVTVAPHRLARMSARVARLDRLMLTELHASANLAFAEAMRQAGVKITTRARRGSAKAAAAWDVADGRITPALLAAVGVTEQELLDRRFDTFGAAAAATIATRMRQQIRATAQALGLDPDDTENEYADDIDQRAAAAAAFLVLALGIIARAALSGHTITPATTKGEYSGPVPFGIVRGAWNIAATRAVPPDLSNLGPGPADLDAIREAFARAGRTLVADLLAREQVTVIERSTWETGDPARPFDPHQRLGEEGASWLGDDRGDILAADPGEFPYVEEYEPGDHDGCECLISVSYEPYEGTSGPELAQEAS